VQYSLYVQVLRSPILEALLHGTPAAAGVSQTLRRGTSNVVTELLQKRLLYSAGRPSRWASSHILVLIMFRWCFFTVFVSARIEIIVNNFTV